jgi:SAM-dependent methyltransferase
MAHVDWAVAALERYRSGAVRDRVLHDLILEDAAKLGRPLTLLDIGCGKGFDTDVPLQKSLVRAADRYIGIEPDAAVDAGEHITDVRRCLFEEADLPPGSIDLAFAVMVLEHLPEPQRFWDKLHEVLRPGGVFWGMTVDARHWFRHASLWSQRLRLKEWYLTWLMGVRGEERYENYPVHYRCNTPERLARFAASFRSVECANLSRVGQCDDLLPARLRPLSRRVEASAIARGKPGTLLLVRAVK